MRPSLKVRTSKLDASGRAYSSRSEEHTSELQSRRDLVCRLLLEKKKNRTRSKAEIPTSARSGGGRVHATTHDSSRLPRVSQAIGYGHMPDAGNARDLFAFAALA